MRRYGMTLRSSLRQPLGEQDDGTLTTRDKLSSSSSSSRPEISPYQADWGEGKREGAILHEAEQPIQDRSYLMGKSKSCVASGAAGLKGAK